MAHPAAATPPDMLTVRDVLFGSTPNQVMVLRTTQDNLGQYYAEQRDTILIVIDRATGREQQYPVYRMRSEADFDIDPMGDRRIARAVPLANAVDPFALLTAAGGMPLIGDGDPPAEGWNTGTAADVDGVMVLTFADGRTARAPMAAILQQMDATLQTTAGVLGDYSRIAPIGTADLLSGRTHACRPISARRIDDRSGTAATAILRVDCEEDGDAGISLLTVLTMDSAADGSAAD
ncbi:hypothetical protein GRI97_11000 [Altererythrobacter xixiisoli]|uniref:Uncharacterized protein n=1 Tax=Croceibacterium xixiisoli TaxID=1476466 RepID=A0A6I4TU11_9SPHN|nr:hypothetical protein [Croceibacterium xixiisoli]MXO99516.1 hypothetical protein [Croceibacterium xixiisoli]